jgi:hypothetical protein
MRRIRKKILRGDGERPVAVQIEYDDWLEIERLLKRPVHGSRPADRYAGTIHLGEDPLQFQNRLRGEWS